MHPYAGTVMMPIHGQMDWGQLGEGGQGSCYSQLSLAAGAAKPTAFPRSPTGPVVDATPKITYL